MQDVKTVKISEGGEVYANSEFFVNYSKNKSKAEKCTVASIQIDRMQ